MVEGQCCCYVVDPHAHCQEDHLAVQFDQMHERGIRANVYIYNALIKAQASTGDIGQVTGLTKRPCKAC